MPRVKVKIREENEIKSAALVNADQDAMKPGATSYPPMNKTTEYIDAPAASEREKAALPKTDIRAVHQALDAEHRTYSREDDSPQGSVKARLGTRPPIHWRRGSY